MRKTTVENGVVVEKYNVRLKLANTIPPERQWWVIEGVLTRAESLGISPHMKQVNDKANNAVLIFFQMSEIQRQDFLATYPPLQGGDDAL